MAIADYRDIVLVAGQDPYAYKGTVDVAVTHSGQTRTVAATADPSDLA